MPTFLHAADIHLDSKLRGLERYEGAPVTALREATRDAFVNLVQAAIDRQVAFLLLIGDLFDGDWRDYHTGLFFNEQMSRLRKAGIDVSIVSGNHDAASQVTKHLTPLPNVHFFDTKAPETRVLEELGVALHGQGYASRAVVEDLSAAYPPPIAGLLNVGLLHTCAEGSDEHKPYAPCTIDGLRSRGYQYWALGHVHARKVLSEDPWIVFPGNLQGRHAKETGPKGATLVAYEGDEILGVEALELDVLRWERVVVAPRDATSGDDVLDAVRDALEEASAAADGRPLAARIEIVGPTAVHALLHRDAEQWVHEIRSLATDVGEIWIEKVRLATSSLEKREDLEARDDALGALVRALDDLEDDPEALARFSAKLDDLRKKLPQEILGTEGEIPGANDDDALRRALLDAKELLLARLLEGGAA